MKKSPGKTCGIVVLCFVAPSLLALMSGCDLKLGGAKKDNTVGGPSVKGVNLVDAANPTPHDQPIIVAAAKNEWASFALQLSDIPTATPKKSYSLRVRAPSLGGSETMSMSSFSAAQIVSMPVNLNRAGYVRHTGQTVSSESIPRALLPMPMDEGVVDLSTVRDPDDATNPASRATSAQSTLLWIDFRVPPELRAGEYEASCEIIETGGKRATVLASAPLKLTVYDFVIPDERHLIMSSRLDWDDLKRLYPAEFETLSPRLLNRTDATCAGAIKALDDLMRLAQENRTQLIVPRLQPTVKWGMAGKPATVDWSDLDTVIAPWLRGEAFIDKIPLGYWPLPKVDFLENFDRKSQLDYWSAAAAHFDQSDWLARSAVFLEKSTPGRAGAAESLRLSVEAAQILAINPNLRVTLPLEDEQLVTGGQVNQNLIDPKTMTRLLTSAPGLVFASPVSAWPENLERPLHWLRTDLPGLVPYAGAGGDERDVRLWSWLARLRNAEMITWSSGLPRTTTAQQPADPNDLVWFYPGSWFGVDEPVPTIQLKWLRRAQQDFEYHWLAKQRGDQINPLLMARLITKPVEIRANQTPDPAYALMSGTTDQTAWNDALNLVAKSVLLREPGQAFDPGRENELSHQIYQWCAPQEAPMLMGRSTFWNPEPPTSGDKWVSLRFGIDVYNASDVKPDKNLLQWDLETGVPSGWEVKTSPVEIPALSTYHVQRYTIDARCNLDAIKNLQNRPTELKFTHGFTRRDTKLKFVLPVAQSERHPPGLLIDGKLDDWTGADAIQNGALVSMFDRPTLQQQSLKFASEQSNVFTSWADDNFYVAFKFSGIRDTQVKTARNFVDYEFRRAWGEDLCEMLMQAVYADGSTGPVLHVVCKPTGPWVERKTDPRVSVTLWESIEANVRYSTKIDGADWRGEVAIPWKAIDVANKGIPPMLRFNFAEHHNATGESASWAGPVDFGRDDSFMGLLYIKENTDPGMRGK